MARMCVYDGPPRAPGERTGRTHRRYGTTGRTLVKRLVAARPPSPAVEVALATIGTRAVATRNLRALSFVIGRFAPLSASLREAIVFRNSRNRSKPPTISKDDLNLKYTEIPERIGSVPFSLSREIPFEICKTKSLGIIRKIILVLDKNPKIHEITILRSDTSATFL